MAKAEMCSYSGGIQKLYSQKDMPKHVRCPVCGRRMKPRLYDSHYNIPSSMSERHIAPDWHYKIPPHKIKGWWKRKKRK